MATYYGTVVLPARPRRPRDKAKVNIDYHVEVDHNYCSEPHQLVRQRVDVRLTTTTVEILHAGKRAASHPRVSGRGGYITEFQHRPVSHQKHLEWTPSRIVSWAESVGPRTATYLLRVVQMDLYAVAFG